MDIREHNRQAWDSLVAKGSEWAIPVGSESIAGARSGHWSIYLTPVKPVPNDWFPSLEGKSVLCLASGGGQQGPMLAAAGATVTVLDNSPAQLAKDRLVADREHLTIATIEGDMRDLSIFTDHSFDLIVHPVSNSYVPNVRPIWNEAFRVLRHTGSLMSGFTNPAVYLFDYKLWEQTGNLEVRHALPYSDVETLSDQEKARYHTESIPFEFSHTLEEQIGGQLNAGFLLTGFYEDYDREVNKNPCSKYMPTYIATRAIKP